MKVLLDVIAPSPADLAADIVSEYLPYIIGGIAFLVVAAVAVIFAVVAKKKNGTKKAPAMDLDEIPVCGAPPIEESADSSEDTES